MSTRKIRATKDEIEKGASSAQSKDRNTNTRVAAVAGAKRTRKKATSETSQKPARKRATTASKEATVKGSRKITNKKVKGIEGKEYKKKSATSIKREWPESRQQFHVHNPGRINNEDNTRGLGVRKREQSARNISGEQLYEHGASVYGEGDLYRTSQSETQYPPYDREGYTGKAKGFRDENNYDDRYWWEGQFPQGASSWEGDSRWQHHDKPWSHRQNQQGHRSNAPYGGDYDKHAWLQRQREGRGQQSEDYERGFSRGHMALGEAIYPDDQRRREDIYQDPGLNYDRNRSGYYQAYSGGDDIGHVPDRTNWNEGQGGSHFHRDDDWENYREKRRDMNEYELHARREEEDRQRGRRESAGGSWGPREGYTQQGGASRADDEGRRQDNEYHSRSMDIRDRIMDYLEEGDNDRPTRTVWTNSLDEPYMGGYNTRTPQSDRRVVGQGGYNQGGYGKQGYSYEYGNAGGYGSTGAYQTGHRGEHRRGDYDEGYIYAERQDEFKKREMNTRDYDPLFIAGNDDATYDDVEPSYKARLNRDDYEDNPQFEGNVHGMRHYGEGEGSKWKNR